MLEHSQLHPDEANAEAGPVWANLTCCTFKIGRLKTILSRLILFNPNQNKVMELTFTHALNSGELNRDKGMLTILAERRNDCAAAKLRVATKLLRVMRLTSFILIVCSVHVSAKTVSQTVTYTGKNISLDKVFSAIEKQTGYMFLYNPELIEKANPINVEARQMPLEQFLGKILENQSFEFLLKDRTIVISPKIKAADLSPRLPSLEAPPVTGVIRDAKGNPLPGVNVVIKGTKKGTTTDAYGNFSINAKVGDKLVVSSIGYQAQEIDVTSINNLSISLALSTSPLDEVQIIAYGTQSNRYSVGNVTTVDSKVIEKQPVNNPLLALQGRIPGLFISQMNGLPGGGINVKIQGQNSIVGLSSPFYVVDGIPFTAVTMTTTNNGPLGGVTPSSGVGSPLNYINPNDIESITILKDADATAIYGSRAANGVILITTKKGISGETRVNFNLQQGFGKVGNMMDMLNTQQYLQMRHKALMNDGISVIGPYSYDINGLWDTTRYTNWQKELIGNKAKYADYTASISGGTANTQFYIGGTYHRETTVFPIDNADKKASLHFNLTNTSTNKKFNLTLTGSYLGDNNNLPTFDPTSIAIKMAPNAPALRNQDGSLNWAYDANGFSSWTNPLASFLFNYESKGNNLMGSALVSYEILPGLTVKTLLGYNNLQINELQTSPIQAISPAYYQYFTRTANYSASSINSWNIEPQLTYKRVIGKGTFDALIGTTVTEQNNNGLSLTGSGYTTDAALPDIRSASTVKVNNSIISEYRYNALFGRLNYIWKNKYIVNLTARRDGSSRFGSANQFHNFWSVGGAWIFTEEKLFNDMLPWLSFGKLRGSYGTTGNDQIGEYGYLNLYSPTTAAVPYQNATGLSVNGFTNPFLQWEETKKLQVGIDLGFIKDRIIFSGSYVRNRSSNQLMGYQLPIITGFTYITANFPATLQNEEWQFTLSTKNIRNNNLNWSSNFNLTVPKNELVSFPGLEQSGYSSSYIIGQPTSITKIFHLIGVDPATGVYQFASSHGQPTSNPAPGTDNTIIVNTLPKFYGGIGNNIIYKQISLDFFFQFVKQSGFFAGSLDNNGRQLANQPVEVLTAWQTPGDNSSIQRFNSNNSLFSQANAAAQSDAAFTDASYVRLKNISLNWAMPDNLTKKMHLQNASLYLQGQNVLTITKYQGLDPETQSLSVVPPLKVLTLGIKIGF